MSTLTPDPAPDISTPAPVGAAIAAQRERERILARLHDTTLQELEQIVSRGAATSCGDCLGLAEIARRAAADLRQFIACLGDQLPSEPLLDGVRSVVDEARVAAGPDIELACGRTDGSVSGAPLAAMLGALREALTNARKHSGARRVVVYCEEHDARAVIQVRDDGSGADSSRFATGLGIPRSIIGRMRSSGGWARVERVAEHGLTVTIGVGTSLLPL